MSHWRVATIGIVGLPNHGKSTLLNSLVGEKVSAVSKKAQTTRQRMTGLITEDGLEGEKFQVLLLDLPGWVEREDGLNKFLRHEFTQSLSDVDGILLLVESTFSDFGDLDPMMKSVREMNVPVISVLTKSDLGAPSPDLLEYVRSFSGQILVGSAKQHSQDLKKQILLVVKTWGYESAEPLYDQDIYTLEPTRTLVAEVVREQCFEQLSQEVPYGLAVQVRRYEESDRLHRIFMEIIVSKESHKPIVIGQGGARIKSIGTNAREQIEKALGVKVFLDLRVRVNADWMTNPQFMKELGYGRS